MHLFIYLFIYSCLYAIGHCRKIIPQHLFFPKALQPFGIHLRSPASARICIVIGIAQ